MEKGIEEKLRKILAKADPLRNPSEEEVQEAMKMAQRLAVKHNIDLATISAEDETAAGGISTDRADLQSKVGRTRRPHHIPLSWALKECFQVKFIWFGGSNCSIVGETTDVQLAKYCWEWLDPIFPKLYLAYIKEIGLVRTKEDNNVRRRSFYEGVSLGIRKNNKRVVEELEKTEANQYAMVLVKKEEVVEARYADEFPNVRTTQSRSTKHHSGAYNQGFEAGKSIKLNGGLGAGSSKGAIR